MQRQRQKNRNRNRLSFSAVTLFVAAALLAGCSDSPKTTAPAASAQKQPIASAPTGSALLTEVTPSVVFSYRPAGKRDPFAPIITKQEKKGDLSGRPPLERYNISEFKLSGIIWGGFGYNAMLEGPDGKGYFIREGTILGPNRGVVKKITSNMLVIEEKFKNSMGEIERKEITVQLRKKQEEHP